MRSKCGFRAYESRGWGEDQSSGPAVTVLPAAVVRGVFAVMLCWRLGRMAVRSVRWVVVVEKRAEAAKPARPVPAPSSRIRGWVGGGGLVFVSVAGLMPGKRRGRRVGRRLARR